MKKKDDSYQQLKTKLFLVSVIVMFLSIIGITVLYNFVIRGRFADFVVEFLRRVIYAGQKDAYDRALETYRQVVRNYREWYFMGGVLFLLMVAQMIYLNSFIKYFTEINRGIDALVTENTSDVILP